MDAGFSASGRPTSQTLDDGISAFIFDVLLRRNRFGDSVDNCALRVFFQVRMHRQAEYALGRVFRCRKIAKAMIQMSVGLLQMQRLLPCGARHMVYPLDRSSLVT